MSMMRGLQHGGKYGYVVPFKYYIRTQGGMYMFFNKNLGIRVNNNNLLDAGTWLTNSEYVRLFK